MITYQKEPISFSDASKLKAWLTSAEAQLFRDCVSAQLHEHYVEAINIQIKPSESVQDSVKFNIQAESHLIKARQVQDFIRVFEQFSNPAYGFHKLKINT